MTSKVRNPITPISVLMVLALTSFAYPSANAATQSNRIQGKTYNELAKLPDFSGLWLRVIPPGTPLNPLGPAQTAGAGDASMRACQPAGLPRIMFGVFPMEFLFTPGRVTLLIEFEHSIRNIYTDRQHGDDPEITYMGESIGHWEGDTLVVDTVGIRPRNMTAAETSNGVGIHMLERMRLESPDILSIETTVNNPGDSIPQKTTQRYERHRDWKLREYYCEDNPRDTINDKGEAAVDLSL
ncbi:MAG: hypothetical protein QM808_08910 [Steroidobacteraceae bacterium]